MKIKKINKKKEFVLRKERKFMGDDWMNGKKSMIVIKGNGMWDDSHTQKVEKEEHLNENTVTFIIAIAIHIVVI